MSTRKAMVVAVNAVSIGDDSSPAWEIETDLLTEPADRAFYIDRAETPPSAGQPIEWGDHHVWYGDKRVRKLGLNFDPFRPLH